MTDLHPLAPSHVPFFITAPGDTDVLYVLMAIVLIGSVLGAGVFFFWLHSLPERMVHNKIQFDIVAVLALLSLFTHQHAFWVAALIIALIKFPAFSLPDFSSLLGRIADSLETMSIHPVEPVERNAPSSTQAKQAAETLDPASQCDAMAKIPAKEPHAGGKTAGMRPKPQSAGARPRANGPRNSKV